MFRPVVSRCSSNWLLKVTAIGLLVTVGLSQQLPTLAAQDDESQANAAAFELIKPFRRGVNFGNFLEVPPGQDWGDNSTTARDFEIIRKQGFDHIRIPIGWHHYTGAGPQYLIEEKFFKRVEQQLDWAEQAELAVLINVHHFDEFIQKPDAQREKLMRIWEQIATRFRKRPLTLAYEILNEPNGAADGDTMNEVYAEAVRRIRDVDPRRLIIVGPDEWNSVRGLDDLQVPDDPRVAVTVHCYEPFLFTHQGANWTPGMESVSGVVFPGPGKQVVALSDEMPQWVANHVRNYNESVRAGKSPAPAFVPLLKEAAAWGAAHHRPIYVGEFGAIATADPESRARFYESFRKTAEELEMGWCIWDWKAGFRYWDRQRNAPEPGMQEALFGERE